jgi:RecB family exonuclease
LSVTDVERLIRDPYAIYAKHVLRLRPLDPLVRLPDPRIKGIAIHGLLDQFIKAVAQGTATLDRESFLDHAREVLDREVPWPTARLLWQGQLARSAEWFVANEEERRSVCELAASEIQAVSLFDDLGFTLTARADRIDRAQDGTLVLYDYKTGSVPTKAQQKMFNKQLLLEAAMAEAGDFKDMLPAHVSRAAYIGIGSQTEMEAPLDEEPPHDVWAQFRELIAAYLRNETGFTSRRMMERDSDTGDYDQLARYGEWDETLHPVAEDLS